MNGAAIAIEAAGNQRKSQIVEHRQDDFDRRTLLAALWVFVGYFLGAKLGFALTFQPHPVSVLWPPNAILVAALLLTSPRMWWVFLLAALPAHWIVQLQSDVPPTMVFCWYVSNCSEALIGAGVARLLIGEPMRFHRLRNVGVFCLSVAFLGPFLSSFIDAGFVIWNRFGQGAFWEIWRIRLISNVLAALTIAPLIVTWVSDGRLFLYKLSFRRCVEGAVLLFLLVVTSYMVLYQLGSGTNWVLPYLSLPFLLWAAVRFGAPGASTAIGTVAFLTIWSAAHGHGPFSGGLPEQNAVSVQIFLIVLAVPILFLGTLKEELTSGETELRESESRFRVVADAAPVMVWVTREDKSYTFINKAWLEFTGRRLEQELGDGWTDSVHPEDRERCFQTYATAFDLRKPFTTRYRLRRHDGEYRVVTDTGVPHDGPEGDFRGYIGAVIDVTDLLQQQKALHEFEERVALAADAAHLGVWELNTETNELWMSDKARELFQFPREGRVSFADFHDRIHPEDRAMPDAASEHAIETQGGYEVEYRTLLPDGTVRWISGRAHCVPNESGKLTRLLGVSMDVTERREAQERFQQEVRASRDQISRLSRVSLLGEMTASIAHELNQPLTGIASNANAAQRFIDRGNVDLNNIREILVDIAADGRRASNVIQHIRNTIKKGAALREQININELVTRVSHMLQPDARAHSCKVTVSLGESLPPIEGDPIEIQQVLVNLVGNALDAMTKSPPEQREVKIATTSNGDGTIRVSVRDFGPGIAKTATEHLFDQFFTTKEEGIGMGLAIVRSVIESHGGKIEAENVDGGGARFYFTLPAKQKSK